MGWDEAAPVIIASKRCTRVQWGPLGLKWLCVALHWDCHTGFRLHSLLIWLFFLYRPLNGRPGSRQWALPMLARCSLFSRAAVGYHLLAEAMSSQSPKLLSCVCK